jgi:hypothetical protein
LSLIACPQVKALALGAKGVGLGRAFLYANGTYGEEGCDKTIESKFLCPRKEVVAYSLE